MRYVKENKIEVKSKAVDKLFSNSLFLALCSILLFGACKKQNLDYKYDYRENTEAAEASMVRLINLSKNDQLVVNGDSLTNFFAVPPDRPGTTPEQRVRPGTTYFPANGVLGRIWNVPRDVLGKNGTAKIRTTEKSWYDYIKPTEIDFTIKEDYSQPKDYFLLLQHDWLVEWTGDRVVEVPREITAPSKPDHFKIRIVNFSAKPISVSSPMEDLTGNKTLAFADGTPVESGTTENIPVGEWSPYVEVPYGTYQFKVLTADGRQVPQAEMEGSNPRYIHPPTSTIAIGDNTASNITYAPVRSFQPGGVYTIVVHPKSFTYSDPAGDVSAFQNGFHIISDITEPANRTYARVQLANALLDRQLSLTVNSKKTESVAEGAATNYLNVIAGSRELTVQDASGKELVSLNETLTSGANYTLWVYPDADGNAVPLLVSNNLGGSWFVGDDEGGGDASIDRRKPNLPFDLRFLNLCADIPYLTVADNNGQPFGSTFSESSGSNLRPGIPLFYNPYTRQDYWTTSPYQFLAYASAPGRLPGDWLKEIPYLPSEALVARKELYTDAKRQVPAHEPGVYSIALIGKYMQGTNNARFMVVKHTK